MTDVAIATNRDWEDPDDPALLGALAGEGLACTRAAWDDPAIDWGSFDATVIRSTWDYPRAHAAFVAWATSVERLVNPADVVVWNTDKHYLDDLASRGVPIIPTTYATSGAGASFPDGEVVVKPTVGGGSRGAQRFSSDDLGSAAAHVDALVANGHVAMVQPYLESAATRGETDVVVIDGVVSHAVTKHAPIGLAADAAPSGPSAVVGVTPTDAELAVVDAALAAVPWAEPLCFARVDLFATERGPVVIELELVEPFLFLEHRTAAARDLARAIARRARR